MGEDRGLEEGFEPGARCLEVKPGGAAAFRDKRLPLDRHRWGWLLTWLNLRVKATTLGARLCFSFLLHPQLASS